MRLPALLLAAALPAPLLAADPPRVGEDLFPLVVGNTWTYRVQPFLTQPPNYQEERFIIRVVRTEAVGDQTCFVLEGKLKDRVTATEHVAFTKDGLTRFRADNVDIVPPVTVLKFAATPKTPLTTEFQLGDRRATAKFTQFEPRTFTHQGRPVRATRVEGDLGAGENGGRVRSTAWYAPGVGMVRQQIEEGKRTTALELEKFDKAE